MFRFNIRDVLWLTALVAMGTSWWNSNRENVALRTYNAIKAKSLELKSQELVKATKDVANYRRQAGNLNAKAAELEAELNKYPRRAGNGVYLLEE